MNPRLAELLRRRIPHVFGVYLAAGWGLIESTDWAIRRFGFGPAPLSWVLGMLAVCLPVVLWVSWRLGDARTERRDASEAPPRSVAVLPFANVAGDPETECLCFGLADQILTDLARIGDLRVVARTSSFAYKDSAKDVRSIGRSLGVRAILEGSVQRSGDRLRVTTQLINVSDGYHLWSERFDRDVEDIFRIEDEIAANVARVLDAILHEHELRALTKIPTRDIRAFEFYVRGREFLFQVRRKSLEYALDMFLKALEVDDEFALAYAGVADATAFKCMYYPGSKTELEEAERASLRALEIDPELAEAHSARGAVLLASGRLAEAEGAFKKASELDPRLFDARYLHARTYFQSGRFEDAARLFAEAIEIREDYSAAFFAAQAIEASEKPDEARSAYTRALAVAEKHMELNPDDPRAATMRAVSLARLERRSEALRWADHALAVDPDDCSVRYNLACLFSVMGELDRSLECLDEAVRGGFGNRDWLERDPDLDAVRADPRFLQTLGAR
jgi:TolB-like protein/Flp pilus assembly protein TadD